MASKKVLEPNQRHIMLQLKELGITQPSVLEIGCGKGYLHHCLLRDGARSVVGVELHADYLAQAKALSVELGHEQRATYHEGDFLELAGNIEPAEVTILDKVVHCNGEPERLVRQAAHLTSDVLVLSFPRNRLWLRCMLNTVGPVMRFLPGLSRLPFRVRFTPPETVRGWLQSEGFARATYDESYLWHTESYRRTN